MNAKILMGIRILFGATILFLGANKLFYFMDPPSPVTKGAILYLKALTLSKTMMLVAIVEITAGISLITNKLAPLMVLVLISVSVNALFYHLKLDQGNIVIGLIYVGLNAFMLYIYKDSYKELIKT